jgi:hypothetical protein
MPSPKQLQLLSLIAVALWILATASIRYLPSTVTDPLLGDIGFLTSIPICWLCVAAIRRLAGLTREQLVGGTAFVVAFAMLIDAAALRWAHPVYGNDEGGSLFRLASAWLLWGYGISLAIAMLMSRRGIGTMDPR